jgi:tetrahydromethanopterin S-methyltransferase subunit E
MEGILVPISLFLGAFAMVFGIRYLSNKEKMAMIERGIDPGVHKATPKPFLSLKFGLLLVGLGIGLLVALFTVRGVFGSDMTRSEQGQSVAIYFGFIGIFGGLGLIVSYLVEKKWLDSNKLL